MFVSLPPRIQFEGVPLVWLRVLPLSKVEFTQKLLASKSARAGLVTANSVVIQNNSTRIFILITLMVADGGSSGIGAEWLTTGLAKLKRLLNSHESAILLTDRSGRRGLLRLRRQHAIKPLVHSSGSNI